MPTPTLSAAQVEQVASLVADYIVSQREKYSPGAGPLTPEQRLAMQPFFPSDLLEAVRVTVLRGQRVKNPSFYSFVKMMGFKDLPEFSLMAAITFNDVVVSHKEFSDGLLFHELVHTVQYRKLGIRQFAIRYVEGFLKGGSYEAIPLETNAYELEGKFAMAKSQPFSVEAEVQKWIAEKRF